MKAEAEWKALEEKLSESLPGWEQTEVLPLLALVPNGPECPFSQAVLDSMEDLSTQLPSKYEDGPTMIPVATLDLNIGVTLPAEELVGKLPQVLPASLPLTPHQSLPHIKMLLET
jgi:hypothetical protein